MKCTGISGIFQKIVIFFSFLRFTPVQGQSSGTMVNVKLTGLRKTGIYIGVPGLGGVLKMDCLHNRKCLDNITVDELFEAVTHLESVHTN